MKYLDDLGENVQMLLDSAPSVGALLMKVPPRLRGSVTSIMDSMIPDAEEAETTRRPGSMILILLLRYYTLCIVMEGGREVIFINLVVLCVCVYVIGFWLLLLSLHILETFLAVSKCGESMQFSGLFTLIFSNNYCTTFGQFCHNIYLNFRTSLTIHVTFQANVMTNA